MPMEFRQKYFRMIVLKEVTISPQQMDGEYALNGKTIKGAAVKCLINQMQFDELNKYEILNTVFIYQHRNHWDCFWKYKTA